MCYDISGNEFRSCTIISGWIAGGWNALILQIVNFAVATAIYFPFVKVLDRDLLKNAKKKELLQE